MNIDIANRIRLLRKSLELTQNEFAKKLNCSRDKIVTYELNKINFDFSFLDYICKVFKVNTNWLLNGTGEMFAQDAILTLDEYAEKNSLTALEVDIIKAYMQLDEDIRFKLIEHFKQVFNKNDEIAATKEDIIRENLKNYELELRDELKGETSSVLIHSDDYGNKGIV